MQKKLVIFGNADIAELALFYFSRDTDFKPVAFTVDRDYLTGEKFQGLPQVAFEEVVRYFPAEEHSMFIALSYAQLNRLRRAKCNEAMSMGYRLATYVSSKASVWSANEQIGYNAFILENVVVQPFAKIGNNVTIWSGTHIGHHSVIQDDCFITSQVVVSGGVDVGRGSFIGVNATLRDHIKIGKRCVIGAGTWISRDVEDEGVYIAKASERSAVPSSKLKKL
ncbi:MAG: acetyltransferase [Candidatus Obscuribacterales bacterium]|nr:acetyltransferase [Candidatus Obscuribacterales bacterium]